jgi:hypothetical protein
MNVVPKHNVLIALRIWQLAQSLMYSLFKYPVTILDQLQIFILSKHSLLSFGNPAKLPVSASTPLLL